LSRRLFWGVVIAITLVVFAGSLFWVYRSKIASEVEGGGGKTWISDVTLASGLGIAPHGVKGDGLWNHRLLIAVSRNGLNWSKTYKVLAGQASVPDVIVDKDGYVRV